MHFARSLGSVALLSTLVGVAPSGCAVETYPRAVGYATVDSEGVPVDVYAYPHASYAGGYAYLVGDRWYYPREGRWVELRREPPELYRYRITYAQRVSPGYHEHPRYVPPTQYGYPRPVPPYR